MCSFSLVIGHMRALGRAKMARLSVESRNMVITLFTQGLYSVTDSMAAITTQPCIIFYKEGHDRKLTRAMIEDTYHGNDNSN